MYQNMMMRRERLKNYMIQ